MKKVENWKQARFTDKGLRIEQKQKFRQIRQKKTEL